MSNAPVYEIDLQSFWRDPYPDLKAMRETTPIAYVPQLGATLLTKRDDILVNEKKAEYFSSDQPQGLMTVLMGQNEPRRVAQQYTLGEVTFEPEDRVFLMFSSGNRDADAFARLDVFDIRQDSSASIAFGAGPHFCAGAWASRSLIADCAMPAIFEQLPNLRQDGEVEFGGWAFRGPLALPVAWDV